MRGPDGRRPPGALPWARRRRLHTSSAAGRGFPWNIVSQKVLSHRNSRRAGLSGQGTVGCLLNHRVYLSQVPLTSEMKTLGFGHGEAQ